MNWSCHVRNSAGVNWNSATTTKGPSAIALNGGIAAHWLFGGVAKDEGAGVTVEAVEEGDGVGRIDEGDAVVESEVAIGSETPGPVELQAATARAMAAIRNGLPGRSRRRVPRQRV